MRSILIHLRLHFQLLLAPVFLWGWLVAGGGVSWSIVLAFIALHVFLYAGATALWVYVLKTVPLNIAYPFMGLAFVVVPVVAHFFVGEVLAWQHLAGGLEQLGEVLPLVGQQAAAHAGRLE